MTIYIPMYVYVCVHVIFPFFKHCLLLLLLVIQDKCTHKMQFKTVESVIPLSINLVSI